MCPIIELVVVNDKRLLNPLICHQAHILVTYQYGGQSMSDTLLYDPILVERFKSGQQCQVLADNHGIVLV
ncbi:hypothetical protein CWC22_012745 [Pseudoalteromonas rubra]|uniref:Uncharacterized protein n=1 Tax=Pseudoalteromonas rubra TaxID=43658 RepID=A0A5S3UZR9_9GAMM|nr:MULTISPECIES: hypothetical protein [Pseudoalteromonas]MEC4087323.1 hypothetical protein [Pseudoalteromonas rubra]QPB83814.1 hypothetical protein CWC22_012745 [Pseudoalteromonas rubra]